MTMYRKSKNRAQRAYRHRIMRYAKLYMKEHHIQPLKKRSKSKK